MDTPTLSSLFATYEAGHMTRLAPKTQSAYRSVWRRILRDLPPSPNGTEIAAWLDSERTRVADVHANYGLRVLQSVVRRAVELAGDGAEIQRAVLSVRAPQVAHRTPFCPAPDFFARTAPAARNRAERAWLGVAATGLRKGELLGLRPEDIDDSGAITVQRQRGRAHRKNRIPYVVEVDAETLANLRWTIENRDEARASFGNACQSAEGCVFPWSETYLEFFLARVRDELGAEVDRYLPRRKGWHQFRHRMAKDAKDRGESTQQIADRLGDKSEAMARHYSNDGVMRNALPSRRLGRVDLVVRWIKQAARAALDFLAGLVGAKGLVLQHG